MSSLLELLLGLMEMLQGRSHMRLFRSRGCRTIIAIPVLGRGLGTHGDRKHA
jgi:hypothetical protein